VTDWKQNSRNILKSVLFRRLIVQLIEIGSPATSPVIVVDAEPAEVIVASRPDNFVHALAGIVPSRQSEPESV
jgi:hypothetical protein